MPVRKKRSSQTKGDRYLEFLKTVHLSRLGMDGANFKIDRSALPASFPESEKASAEISGRHEILSPRPDCFGVLGHYKVSVKGSTGSEIVDLTCTYNAQFSLDKEAEQEFIERFARNEVRLVFWPYLRHFIADSTYRMSIPPLQLPLTSELPTTPALPVRS
jgi:preprotein translocase subunit SecB